ncbi:MAG: oxidoreductase [Gammaproteobacteria bacterium]
MTDTRTWFITGCDKGMGHAFAERILERGDRVVATARDPANVADLVTKYHNRAHGYQLDVTNAGQIRSVVAAAEQATGGIDVLVNNAGYAVIGAAEETSPGEYRPMFEVNFFGLVEVTRALLPGMRARGRGHIFCTSSIGGFAASPGFGFYAASKFAVEGFAESLSLDVAALGIKVTILEPGSTRTDFAGGSLVRAATRIPDYERTAVVSTLDRMAARHGAQPNDPRRIADVLMTLARDPAPPLRIPLGQDGVDRFAAKLDALRKDFERWHDLSLSVAFDSGQDK